MFLQNLFKDARYFQILFQSIFLSYGILFLHWHSEQWLYLTFFAASFATQFICEYAAGNKNIPYLQRIKTGIPSALISSFGLCLLLKTNVWWVAVFAAVVSIASKYIIRINGKHIFNPSALGIVVAVLFTGEAWISPAQWGSGMVLLFAVCCLGFIVVTKVQNLTVSLSFIGVFAGLLFIRQIIFLGWPLDFFLQSISTGSLLLFTFFMITDPKTTPNHTLARVGWCVCIAAFSFYLATFKFINGAPIFVLVAAQVFVPLLDYFFKANRFNWLQTKFYTPKKKYPFTPFYNN